MKPIQYKFEIDKIYLVRWHDTLTIESWCNWEDIVEEARINSDSIESIGRYVGQSHNYYVFAAARNYAPGVKQFGTMDLIPKNVITSVTELVIKE